jgi:hypothetical protein
MNIEILKKEPSIIDFIATFSRLEYALKASGQFLKKNQRRRGRLDCLCQQHRCKDQQFYQLPIKKIHRPYFKQSPTKTN